jgi:hypothetical protein
MMVSAKLFNFKNKMAVVSYPVFPYIRKSSALFEGYHTSPASYYRKSGIKMGKEQWWNDTDRGKPQHCQLSAFQSHFAHHKPQIN